MEVLRDPYSPPVLLSNVHVLKLLEKQVTKNKEAETKVLSSSNRPDWKNNQDKKKIGRRNKIQKDVLEYLNGTPCSTLVRPNKLKSNLMSSKKKKTTKSGGAGSVNNNNKGNNELSSAPVENDGDNNNTISSTQVVGYGLTEAESIQIMNLMPTAPVDVSFLVTDSHIRIGDEDAVQAFIDTIQQFNDHPNDDEQARGGGEE